MSVLNTAHRVLGVLALRPMTTDQIARCLCVSAETARQNLVRLETVGSVRRHGWSKAKTRQAQVFEVAA